MDDELAALGTILDALAVLSTFPMWRGRVAATSMQSDGAVVMINGAHYAVNLQKLD